MSTLEERLARAQSDMEQTFSSMLYTASTPVAKGNAGVVKLPISQLHPFGSHTFDLHKEREDFKALVNSVAEKGILEPLLVRPINGENNAYEIIMGHRRKAAAEECGLLEVPCIIQNMNDLDASQAMIETNINRPGWTPSEKARSYALHLQTTEAKLARRPGRPAADDQNHDNQRRTDEIAAEFFGISRDTLHRFIKLIDLSPALLKLVDDNVITVMAGYNLAYLDESHQAIVAQVLDMYPQKRITESIGVDIKSAYDDGTLDEAFLLRLLSITKCPAPKPIRISFQSSVTSQKMIRKAMADADVQEKIQTALDSILLEYAQAHSTNQ